MPYPKEKKCSLPSIKNKGREKILYYESLTENFINDYKGMSIFRGNACILTGLNSGS
jgi:hypothetical protein